MFVSRLIDTDVNRGRGRTTGSFSYGGVVFVMTVDSKSPVENGGGGSGGPWVPETKYHTMKKGKREE